MDLLVVLLALGGYLYFVESKRPAGGDAEKKDKAFTVEADKIEEFTIKSESGERTTLRKSGIGLADRAAAPAQAGFRRGIRHHLEPRVARDPARHRREPLGPHGLQPHAAAASRWTFKAAGKDHKLLIGRKTPPGSDLYARVDDQKRVVLIPSFVDTTFNRTTFDLRDKAVLTVNRDEIGSLACHDAVEHDALRKGRSGEWKLAQPVAARADFSAVEALVSRLTTLQMKSIAAPQATDFAQYGLDKPAATVTIGSGSSQATLAIGKSSGEGAVYARDLSKPVVVTVESALARRAEEGAGRVSPEGSLRRPRVQRDTPRTGPERRRRRRSRRSSRRTRTARSRRPGSRSLRPPRTSTRRRSTNLIAAVTQARASSFVDAAPKGALDKPELTMTIKSNEGKREEKVTFGRSGSATSSPSRAGEPGAAKIEASGARRRSSRHSRRSSNHGRRVSAIRSS